MKNQFYKIIAFCLLLITSCAQKDSILPSKTCSVAPTQPHSKGQEFQDIIDAHTNTGLPGIVLLVKDSEVFGMEHPEKQILLKASIWSLAM